ncbi:MAG TPA: SPFH domain-containing protein [Dehalococcoidia bacterium]|nr:SPFH domain-containing protein [Dehalococcoidia bacterium]
MSVEMREPPPRIDEERAKDEGGLAALVRWMLTIFAFILLIPPWGFIVWFFSVKIVNEYERGVIFRLGRLVGARGPGLFVILPIVDRMVKMDLRTVTMDVPSQEAITKDNVTVRVNAVIYFRVVNPEDAVTRVLDHFRATSQIAQTTLRSVLGQSMLDELLSERERINNRLQQIIDEQTEPWGVKVSTVEVKDVELPQGMQRAMARQAEAERERRAKIINADGELQASERLAEAGRIMSETPATLQLRFLQTLSEVATEKNSTIIFPVPIDLLSLITDHLGGGAGGGANGDGGERRRVRVGPPEAPATPAIPPVEPESHEGTVS